MQLLLGLAEGFGVQFILVCIDWSLYGRRLLVVGETGGGGGGHWAWAGVVGGEVGTGWGEGLGGGAADDGVLLLLGGVVGLGGVGTLGLRGGGDEAVAVVSGG